MDVKIGCKDGAAILPLSSIMRTETEISLSYVDFESMYRAEYPAMIAVATAWSGFDGEDLVHDAMVRAFVHWGRVRQLERPGGWCHRVLINLCRSRWRRAVTRRRWLERQRPSEQVTSRPSVEFVAFWAAVRALSWTSDHR